MAPTTADVMRRAQELDIDPKLALSFFSQESSGNWNTRDSSKGARGGFQVMPDTYTGMMGTSAGQRDPWNNMEAGLRYIAYGQKKLGTRDPELLAAGYHAGYDRRDLQAGRIPNTSDGQISTADYARSVASRVRGERPTRFPNSKPAAAAPESADEFSDTPVTPQTSLDNEFSDTPVTFSDRPPADDGWDKAAAAQQKALDDQPLLDYFKNKGVHGWEGMQQSLDVAKWAVGGLDDATMAEQLAKKMQADAKIKKTTEEQENDAAWKKVSKAEGFIDTTKEAFKAVGTSLSNPKATFGEIVEQGANSIPSMAAGLGGAGTGAAVGGGIGATAGGVGAIPGAIGGAIIGGRTGMAAGTVAVEGAGQIQELISSRLDELKQPPTAQNILALLSSDDFKAEARKQGLAKGLTVATVDQFTMGLGGKIATAPARKIASKALEDQGADMATRAARNAALASPAGKAAMQAAKPTLGARVGAGAAAVGVDATGEVVGDYAGSVAADGTGDIGDSLRGGVMSVGQSGVSVAVGATIETAKLAAAQAKAAVTPTPNAPSTASGPLARAAENAAAEPQRVTVTAPDGQVSGTVTGATQDGTAVQIVGDDGQVYTFATGAEGITITPEAPNTPLSNALEVAAGETATAPDAPPAEAVSEATQAPEQTQFEAGEQAIWRNKDTDQPVQVVGIEPEKGSDGRTYARVTANGQESFVPADELQKAPKKSEANATETFTDVPPPVVSNTPAPVKTPDLPEMSDDELKARRAYISDQAKTNGGWTPMLMKQRRAVEKEMEARAAKVETPKAEPVTQATPAQEAAATLPKDLAGAKPRYNFGNKAFELNFASDVDRAAFIASQPTKSKRDADYLAFAAQATGMSEDEVRAHGAQVREAIKAMAKDGKPGTLKVPEVARGGVTVEKTPAPKAEPTTTELMQAAKDSGKLEIINVTNKVEPKVEPATAPAAAPEANKWFGSKEKADAYIAKKKLGDTHEVTQTGKVRFEITPKKDTNVTDERTSGQPASAEAVGQEANAGQAEATPVQPAAPTQEEVKPTTLAERRAKAKSEAAPAKEEVTTAEQGKPEPAAADATPLQRTEAEIAEWKWRRSLPVNVGQRDFIDGEIAKLEEVADLLKNSENIDAAAPVADTKPTEQPAADPFANNKVFTSDAVEKARARMKSKLRSQFNSGIDPEMVMDGMTIAGAYIEAGTRSFAAYSKAMIDDFGPKIKPFLLSFYEAARNYPGLNTEGLTPVADAKAEFDALNATTDTQPTSTEAKGNDNGPQKLDHSGSRELEGKQSDALQGAEPLGQAGDGAQGSGGADLFGDGGAGSAGPQPAGRVGNDAGEVSSLASRRDAGRGGKQGSGAVQRSERPAKPNSAIDRDSGNQPSLIPEDGTRAQDRADGFVITQDDAIGEGGQKTKFKQNVAAIRLLKELTAENRQATRAEQAVLAKYVGWGGIPQAFYRDNNEVSKGWEKEAAELKELMTADELAAAAASTRNAHYTSTEIVGAVWEAAKHFGFQGGRVLEPSVGVGNFFGLMPTALRSASQLTGVELDHITGGIAKQLYPQANIAAPVGFQDFSAPDNYFELAIGNPPFGREGIYDPTRKKISGFSIHNYFFAKSIDTVKPNGVLAMVVTNRLLDSMGDKARAYIAERSEFLGAIRLPNDAFAKNAGTQVTTDIIFLRKLKEGEQPTGQRWMEVRQYKDKNGNTVPLNEYFVRNPDMMLGDFGQFGSMYSAEDAALVARPGQDTPALLQAAVAKLPKGFMDAPTAEPTREAVEPMHDISRVKVGSVFEQDGQIFERREDMLGKQQAAPVTFASEKAKERVSGMIQVRDALIDVRRMQLQEGVNEKELEAARKELNKAYDAFVKANGPLNADANKRLMRDDPTWPQIAALEDGFDKGISAAVAKTTGETPRAPSARKAAIFSKRTQAPYKAPEKANSAKDAMVSSLAERGRVDLDYMASLYGKTPEAIVKELEGLIFKNPVGGWESREQYLSGNVKKKLAQAIDAAKADPSLKGNVDALKAVQPADIEAVDIDVKAGAHWVPADVMEDFVNTIAEGQNAKAIYNPVTASWTLNVDRASQAAQTQWSTDRASLREVLTAAANSKQITIYDKFSDGTRTLNEAATTAANEKVERIKAEWKNWLWADDARRERLARIYNDTFNTDVQREFDGSHLTFPGKVGDDIIQLRPHQANAVWRMVQSGTTLLDHVVGAGKTFTMIAGIMEMRRMGLAKKPMLVVPNHLVGQWAEDFMKLYPGANILAATKKDFEKGNRKRLFARIATGDWDAVIVAHSSLGKVEMEPEFQEAFIKQQIADMDTSIVAMREAEGKGSRNVKQIEKQKAALEEKLKKLFDTGSKDDNLHFGELGVDAMLLDEAHEFKNLGFSTGMQRVAGLGNPTGSNKAADMFMKVQATLKRTGGKNVVFATGTPISNTMAEMYTMQRYLDYGTLKDQGIAHFDAWAKTFGEVVTDWELSPSGQYKMNSRFAKFVNMPELMQRYGSFADVINRDDINRQLAAQGKKLPVPKVKGGKPENTVVERSRDQALYIGIPTVDENGVETYPEGSLVYRAENLPKKAEKGADNMLKIMSDARKAALDMRLIDPSYGDNPNSKVNVAADNIKATYDRTAKDKGTQLVFIDLSTPKGAVAKEAAALRELVKLAEDGDEAAQSKLDAMSPDELLALDSSFSVYDDLKAKLIAKGIPENEIAFIHDANTELQKEELFGKVRTGRVRVLFGSTAKMGAGMNVQDRLVALHHLDAPWRPSDLEQREGRIIRQGNKLYEANPEGFEVEIKRYATKQTLDSRMWQTIEAKARFIEQVRKGTGEREVEDVAGEASNSAEMKAASSGNPLILEEMTLRQAIRKLENQQSEHNREQFRIRDRIRMVADMAKANDRDAEQFDADAPKAPKEFTATIGNQTFDKPKEAGEAILNAVSAMLAAREESREIGTYGGFKLIVDDVSNGDSKGAVLTLKGKGEYQVAANPGSDPTGLGQRMRNTVRDLAEMAQNKRDQAQRNRDEVPKLEGQIKPWGSDQELADAKARHMEVIDQLKPKKKPEQAAPEGGDVRANRASPLETVFANLEGRGLVRKRALDALANNENAETIRYIENNFWDILGELEDSGKVTIKC
mgnify:CR=1 FL=1